MCAQCFAQGAVYAVPGLALLRVWSRRRTRALSELKPDAVVRSGEAPIDDVETSGPGAVAVEGIGRLELVQKSKTETLLR